MGGWEGSFQFGSVNHPRIRLLLLLPALSLILSLSLSLPFCCIDKWLTAISQSRGPTFPRSRKHNILKRGACKTMTLRPKWDRIWKGSDGVDATYSTRHLAANCKGSFQEISRAFRLQLESECCRLQEMRRWDEFVPFS